MSQACLIVKQGAVVIVLLTLCACAKRETDVTIPFLPIYEQQTLHCGGADSPVQLTDLRFYVMQLSLINSDGDLVKVRTDTDDLWQQQDLVFLDLEDGSGACSNGTLPTNAVLRGKVEQGDYRGVQFTLGVPFERNHADPLQAKAPLGDAAMHWHWRGGYKFLRAGIRSDNDSYWIHLGSTGCKGTIRDIRSCNAPNRVTVRLNDFVPNVDSVGFDFARLVDDWLHEDALATDCSSGPAEMSCAPAFAALGLDFARVKADGEQRVFRTLARP